jgi:hypothetical protein
LLALGLVPVNTHFLLVKIDLGDGLLVLLELRHPAGASDDLETAGEVRDAGLPETPELALAQVLLQGQHHLRDGLRIQGVIQDVGVQHIDKQLHIFRAEEQVSVLVLQGMRETLEERVSEGSAVLAHNGDGGTFGDNLSLVLLLRVSDELVAKRHQQD